MTTKEIFPHPLSVHNYILGISGSSGMYMESGLLDLLNIAPLNPDSYKPAQLYYDDELDTYYQNNPSALLGTLKISSGLSLTFDPRDEGQSESSVGCDPDEAISTVTAVNPSDGDTEVYNEEGAFCPDYNTVRALKRAQTFFPASAFSGKLRMFVQAVYGSKREDYEMDETLKYLGGLEIGGFSLDPYFNTEGYVLYTGEDYNYYLLRLSSSVEINKLSLTKSGDRLRQWLVKNPQADDDERRRYEAYILSTATVGDAWVEISDESYSKGSPLAYSWHANWDGTEAHIVVIREREEADNVYETTHWKMTFSLDELHTVSGERFWEDEDRWTITLVEEEATQEVTFRDEADLMWLPDYINVAQYIYEVQENAFATPTHVESDVPMYVMYDYENDEFDVVRFKRQDKGTGVGILGGSFTSRSTRAHPRCGNYACGYFSEALSDSTEIGFYIDNVWDASGIDTPNAVVAGNEAAVGEPDTLTYPELESLGVNCDNASWFGWMEKCGEVDYDFCDEIGKAIFDYADGYTAESYGTEVDIEGSFEWESMLIVPFSDCDSVHLGFKRTFDGAVIAGRTLDGSSVLAGFRSFDKEGDQMGAFDMSTMEVQFTSVSPDSISAPGGATGIKTHAKFNTGHWLDVSGDTVWSHLDIRYIHNGDEHEAYNDRVVTDDVIATGMVLPACMDSALDPITQNGDAPNWRSAEFIEDVGYEFDPVLYPDAETALPVYSLTNLTDNYRATAEPENDTYIDDGVGYDFDNINTPSFVGHD